MFYCLFKECFNFDYYICSQQKATINIMTNQNVASSLSLPNTFLVVLNINNQSYNLQLDPSVSLLDALREYLGLTGTKKGCDRGQCGACTVLIDGTRINSCLTLAIMSDDCKITTIEGIAGGDELHPLQQAFIEHDAFQCGYCTSGQICSAIGMINEDKAHTRELMKDMMSGNICRCGAYNQIIAAIVQVKEEMQNV